MKNLVNVVKLCTIVVVIIVKILFLSSVFFYCLLCNHSFSTNPNSTTNLYKLLSFFIHFFNFSTFQLFNYIAPASSFFIHFTVLDDNGLFMSVWAKESMKRSKKLYLECSNSPTRKNKDNDVKYLHRSDRRLVTLPSTDLISQMHGWRPIPLSLFVKEQRIQMEACKY